MTALPPFAIERYFALHEFAVPYLLCASDVEPVTMKELLALADDELRELWDGLVLGYTETLGSPLLRREIAGLLSEAVPEAVLDLESVIQRRNRWRSGDAGQGFPQLGREDTEALYAELIDNEQHNADALMSISAKLDTGRVRAVARM